MKPTTEFTIPIWFFNEDYLGRIVILAPLDNRYKECVSPLNGDTRLFGYIDSIVIKKKKGNIDEKTLWGLILNYNYLPHTPMGVHVFSSPVFLSEEDSKNFKDSFPHLFV